MSDNTIQMRQLREAAELALEWKIDYAIKTDERLQLYLLARLTMILEKMNVLLAQIEKHATMTPATRAREEKERRAHQAELEKDNQYRNERDREMKGFLRSFKTAFGYPCPIDHYKLYCWFQDGNKAPFPVKRELYKVGSMKQLNWQEKFDKDSARFMELGFFKVIP